MKLFLLSCCVLFWFTVPAQSINRSISGMVKDMQNEPIAGATVSLLRSVDSLLIQTKMARGNGRFEFSNLSNGLYIVTVTAVGNKKYISPSLTVDDSRTDIRLPAIILTANKKMELKEVVVTAKKPLIEQDIDKTVMNVESLISSAGSNTLEILEKAPGVTVDINGDISLNGRSGILVLIEGRPTYMSGLDLAAYLKSLPGSIIDKIELMNNPPAKYDASGNAVINIVFKRNRVQGYTGNISLSYNQGKTSRFYDALNLNYLRRKINLFGNISYSKDGDYNSDVNNRTFYSPDDEQQSAIYLDNYSRNRSHAVNSRAGLDYTISPKTTVGFIGNASFRKRNERSDYRSGNYNAIDVLDSTGKGNTNSQSDWRQISANINLTHKFNNKGTELSADVNYINYKNRGDQLLYNYVYSPSGAPVNDYAFTYELPSDITIYTAKADYSQVLKNKVRLLAGVKSSWVDNNSVSDYFSIVNTSNNPDYGRSNHFIYKETIHAAYVNGRKDWKRFGIQIGLRVEHTEVKGHQLGNAVVSEIEFKRNYTNAFPSAFISYKIDSMGNHTLNFSYSKRLNRPSYQQLNPFLFFRDQYSYSSGNPYLNPDLNNNIEVGYRFKQYFGFAFQYDRRSNVSFNATQAVNNIFISRPENSLDGYMRAIMVNTNLPVTKWWNVNANFGAARFVIKGKIYTEYFEQRMNACRGNLINQFKFPKDWSAEFGGNFVSRLVNWQRIIEPRYRLNAGIQKKILKGKGSLRVTIDDIFRTFKYEDEMIAIKQASAFRTNWSDTRRVGLSFTFNFGKETFARKRRYTDNTADDVKGRVE